MKKRLLPGIAMGLFLTACTSSAPMDEFFIRGHYRLSSQTKLLYRYSNPPRPGVLGDRHNLLVKATYQLTDEEYNRFLATNEVETRWPKLPIADRPYLTMEEVDRFHKAGLKNFETIKNGFYLCETTSGYGIVEPRKRLLDRIDFERFRLNLDKPNEKVSFFACPPNEPQQDFLLSVLDADEKKLYVVLKQDY